MEAPLIGNSLIGVSMKHIEKIQGASNNSTFVAILRCSRKMIPYISNICGVIIFHLRLVWLIAPTLQLRLLRLVVMPFTGRNLNY